MVFWKHALHAADKKLWEQRFETARKTRRLLHVPGLSLRNERKAVAKLRLRRYIEVLAQQAHPSTGEAPCWTSVTEELSHGSHFGRALVDVATRCYKCQCCCVNCKSHLKSQMSHGQQIDSLLATSSEKLWGAGSKKIAAHVDRQNRQNRSPLLFSDLRDSGLRCAVLMTKKGIVFWPRQSRFLLELLKAIQRAQCCKTRLSTIPDRRNQTWSMFKVIQST